MFDVPVTVTVYACGLLEEAPQPLTLAAATTPRNKSRDTEIMRLRRLPPLRHEPAKGNRTSASENGASVRQRSIAGCAAAEACGNWMVRVSLVVPAPAAMPAGEKTAVAPVGNPLAVRETANGKVVAGFAGVKVKVNTAALPDFADTSVLAAVKVKSGVVDTVPTVTTEAPDVEAASLVVAAKLAVIESAPSGKVVKLSVATPDPFTAPVPMEVVPFKKVTVPVVTGVVPASTVAVKVTLAPTVELLGADSEVVVAAITKPLRLICCMLLGKMAFRLLSRMFTVPANRPAVSGTNSTPKPQLSPAVSEVDPVQVVADPFRLKLLSVWPVVAVATAAKTSGWLPMFCTVTFCGLSMLVWPTGVAAKLKDCCAWFTSTRRPLAQSVRYKSPAPFTTMPQGAAMGVPPGLPVFSTLATPAGVTSTTPPSVMYTSPAPSTTTS